jgi:hypothetical protein
VHRPGLLQWQHDSHSRRTSGLACLNTSTTKLLQHRLDGDRRMAITEVAHQQSRCNANVLVSHSRCMHSPFNHYSMSAPTSCAVLQSSWTAWQQLQVCTRAAARACSSSARQREVPLPCWHGLRTAIPAVKLCADSVRTNQSSNILQSFTLQCNQQLPQRAKRGCQPWRASLHELPGPCPYSVGCTKCLQCDRILSSCSRRL